MPNFQPSLVIDANVETGWCRVEIYGDRDIGKSLIHRARAVLGQMKCNHGVGVASTEGGGGFYHGWKRLPGGHAVHALTNDGQDTIRIYPFSGAPVEVPVKKPADDFEPGLYLWVGVRVKDSCRRPYYGLVAMMLEPEGGDSRGYRGFIHDAYGTSGEVQDNDVTFVHNADGTVSIDTTLGRFDPLETMIDKLHTTWGPYQPSKTRGDHNLAMFGSDDRNANDADVVLFSANGLMMQDWIGSGQAFGPHDPRMSVADNAGASRDFSLLDMSADTNGTYTMRFGWDTVFWIDPWDYKRVGDTDTRPEMLALTQMLRDQGFITKGRSQVLPGKYKLAVFAYDTPPHLRSTRAGEAIPDFPGYTRSADCDYRDFMEMANVWPTLDVEVEVRIGKRDYIPDASVERNQEKVALPGATFKFDLTCTRYDNRNAVATPFWSPDAVGGSSWDSCTGDGGANMGGPSWSEWIEIDVLGGTAALASSPTQPPVMGAGSYHDPVATKRFPTNVYVYGGIFPQPTDADFPGFAGNRVWIAVESMTSGVYGCDEMNYFSKEQITAAFAAIPALHDHVYRYNTSTGEVDDMGTWSGAAVGYTNPPDNPNFDWYYPYAISDHNACINTMGVLVISDGTATYDGSQNYNGWPGHNDSVNCC